MSTFHSAAQLVAKFERVSRDMHRLPEILVEKAGNIVAREIKHKAGRTRIPRSKPAKLGAKVDVQARSGTASASAMVTPVPRGLWAIAEEGANAHVVTSKYAGGSRKSRANRFMQGDSIGGGPRAVINIPGIGYRKYAVIPKTRGGGKGNWEAGVRNSFGPVRDMTGIDISHIIERD